MPKQSENMQPEPLGRVMKVTSLVSGHTEVRIDNGPASKIDILAYTEDAAALLDSDLTAIRDHLMTPRSGRFRVKRT